ncbi:MAG: Ig-like domain-containing protein, partial [Chitinophagaceae bacterium]
MRFCSATILALFTILLSCDKKDTVIVPPASFAAANVLIDGNSAIQRQTGVSKSPLIKILFTSGIKTNSAEQNISVFNNQGIKVPSNISFENNDSTVILVPQNALSYLTQFKISINEGLEDKNDGKINSRSDYLFLTSIDSTDKFPRISDNSLLDSVQRRSFAFFWEFGHPVSGMARERNSSGDLVTSGGTGFGIMAMVAAANRGFITRTESRD